MRIFGSQIDVALSRADRQARDRHAFDQDKWIALHRHPIGEGSGVSLIGVAYDVLLIRRRIVSGLPFDSCRESRSPASAQSGLGDFFDDLLAAKLQGIAQSAEPSELKVIRERYWIGYSDTSKRQALLI